MHFKKMILLMSSSAILFTHAQYHVYITPIGIPSNTHRTVHIHATCNKKARGGFFSEFNNVLANLIYYEKEKIASVYVDWTHPYFPYKDDPNENSWDLYFEPIIIPNKLNGSHKIKTVRNHYFHELHGWKCTCVWTDYDAYLPYRLFIHRKIMDHIRIKQSILNAVETFYNEKMKGYHCIGVQVRNAKAHEKESPFGHQPISVYVEAIDQLRTQHGTETCKIFVATDSDAIIPQLKKIYGSSLIYLDTYRAHADRDHSQEAFENIEQFHLLKPGYRGGLGALMDCLLLAKCDDFIHITSYLAQAVTFFNPHINSIFLPKDAPHIPCRIIRDKQKLKMIRNPYIMPIKEKADH